MNIDVLISFFMWCTIINGSLLILWVLAWMAIPDLISMPIGDTRLRRRDNT